ncbi:MAG: prepilin peptidase [Gemmatimonadetes bacterium]|nr:prepilin peptidase [Gemmatimonadota bacterium]
MDVLLNEIDAAFLLEWALLCSIMVVASYTTYTDISHREIPNSATWILLGLGLTGQMGLWVLGEVTLVQIGLSFVLGFAVGYLLFMYGFWGAGDAKLYWAMVAAIPSTLFGGKWPTFSFAFFSLDTPLWALLVNTILTNTVFLVALLVIHKPAKPVKTPASDNEKGMSWEWVRSGIEAAGVSGLVLGGTTLVGATLTLAEAIVVGAVLYLLHEDRTKVSQRVIWVVPGLVIGLFSAIGTGDYLIYLVLWAVLWGIRTVYVYIHSLEYQKFVQPVAIDALQPGMVLHQSIYEAPEKDRVEVVSFGKQSRDTQELIGRTGKPLTIRKVRQLKELQKKGLFREWDDQVEVELSLPFAPILMVGVSLTLIWAGSIVRPANRWIQPLFDAF